MKSQYPIPSSLCGVEREDFMVYQMHPYFLQVISYTELFKRFLLLRCIPCTILSQETLADSWRTVESIPHFLAFFVLCSLFLLLFSSSLVFGVQKLLTFLKWDAIFIYPAESLIEERKEWDPHTSPLHSLQWLSRLESSHSSPNHSRQQLDYHQPLPWALSTISQRKMLKESLCHSRSLREKSSTVLTLLQSAATPHLGTHC